MPKPFVPTHRITYYGGETELVAVVEDQTYRLTPNSIGKFGGKMLVRSAEFPDGYWVPFGIYSATDITALASEWQDV